MDKQKTLAFEILDKKVRDVGLAKVAVALSYKDTEAIKKWVYRKTMPTTAAALIIKLWGHERATES